jgi:hypothetical protein
VLAERLQGTQEGEVVSPRVAVPGRRFMVYLDLAPGLQFVLSSTRSPALPGKSRTSTWLNRRLCSRRLTSTRRGDI